MDLLNKQVLHKSFGKGSIVECNDSYMVISFKTRNRDFVYPDAFADYLTLIDKSAAESIEKIIEKLREERRHKELKLEEEKALELEKQQYLLKIEKLTKNFKIQPVSQVVFNCGQDELNEIFTEWKVFTGTIKSGKDEGKPNKLIRVHQNSVCVITSKYPQTHEKDRQILGIYMADETFVGRMCEDGYIPAHPDYRIQLTNEESAKLPLWKYYINNRYPGNITWNSGRHRYFDNMWAAQILRDIVLLKNEEQEIKQAQEFFEYFCLKNQIEKKEIPAANGALMRV